MFFLRPLPTTPKKVVMCELFTIMITLATSELIMFEMYDIHEQEVNVPGSCDLIGILSC